MSMTRLTTLPAMVIALLMMTPTALAEPPAPEPAPASEPPSPAPDPVWERLTVTEVPEDALRRFGNTAPPSATAAHRSWKRVQGRLRQARAHLKMGRVSTTTDEVAEDRRALAMVVSGNPVVCRARHDREWVSGLLSPSAETCILNVSIAGQEQEGCMRYRRMGPECRPHIQVMDNEVYILRHAQQIHMVHLSDEVGELEFPRGGLVGLEDAVFGALEPMCLFGDSRSAPVGVLSQQGTALRCRASVLGSEEPGAMSFGYGNLDLYTGRALEPLTAHLEMRSEELATLEVAQGSWAEIAPAKAALQKLEDSLAAVRAELDEKIDELDPLLRARARVMIEAKLGETLTSLDAQRAALVEQVAGLELEREIHTFIQSHAQPLIPELEEAGKERAEPLHAEEARAELEALLKLRARVNGVTAILESELSAEAQEGARARLEELIAERRAAMEARLKIVSHLAVDLSERARINEVAEGATVLLANMTVEDKSPEKTKKLYDGLMDQLEQVTTALAREEPNPALAAHARETLEPLIEQIQERLDALETSLPPRSRLEVLDRFMASSWTSVIEANDPWAVVGLVSEMLPEMERLVSAEDELATQMHAARRWTELRHDVLDHIQSHALDAPSAQEAEEPVATFRSALAELPSGGKKAQTAQGARLAKVLRTNGFAWSQPQPDSAGAISGAQGRLPVIHPLDWWRAAKIRPSFAPVVAAWTRCTDAIAADWSGKHTYLKTCNRVFKKHSESPVIRELAADIHKELQGLSQSVSWDECVKLRWKHPRAFFVSTVKGQCQIIKEREQRQREIRKARAEIQEYVTKKNFRYARMLLSNLRAAGAERWEIANATTTIETAERFETDRKARQAAELRAKSLMSQMPTIELACQQERKSWRYAENEFVRAVRNGESARADRYESRKQRLVARGCEAKKKMTEVVAIYESQGRPVAAQALVENGQTCFRSWACEDELSER